MSGALSVVLFFITAVLSLIIFKINSAGEKG
jgi:ABC-type sugar transport system permease subunit